MSRSTALTLFSQKPRRRLLRRAALALAFSPALVSPSLAAAQGAPPHTLPELIRYALRANPDVRTARLREDSAHGELRIARAIPNPTFSVAPGSPYQYSVTQLVDIGPARVYRSRASRRGLEGAAFDVKETAREVSFNVAQGYYDLLLAEALRDVAQAQRDVFERLLVADSIRLKNGDLAQRDVAATELQAARSEAALARATAVARSQRVAVQVLVGITAPDTAYRVAGSLDFRDVSIALASLDGIARERRPDLAASLARLEQSRDLSSLARANLLPVPGVTVVYQNEPFPNGSTHALGFGLSLPVFDWFGGERERARAGESAAEIALQRSQVLIRSDLAVAVENYRASRALAERYTKGQLLQHNRAAVDMQRFAYQQGAASLIEFLTALSAFNDIQTDYYTALHDYWVSVYAIDSAVGGGLIS